MVVRPLAGRPACKSVRRRERNVLRKVATGRAVATISLPAAEQKPREENRLAGSPQPALHARIPAARKRLTHESPEGCLDARPPSPPALPDNEEESIVLAARGDKEGPR